MRREKGGGVFGKALNQRGPKEKERRGRGGVRVKDYL